MTVWVLIWVISGDAGYQGNSGSATASAVFHTEAACQEAAKHFHKAFCLADPIPEPVNRELVSGRSEENKSKDIHPQQ